MLGAIDEVSVRAEELPHSFGRTRGDDALASLPGGIRLAVFTSPFIVRWVAWLVALVIVVITDQSPPNNRFEPFLLIGTFIQTLSVTFYVPLLRPRLQPRLRTRFGAGENDDILALGLADVTLAMLAVYLSGGWGSPYYHFALTALLLPSFFLSFRGVAALAAGYTAAYIFGVMTFGEGVQGSWRDSNLNGFIGAVVTPLLVALVPNYLGTLLRNLDVARGDAVGALAGSELLAGIARCFLEGGTLDEVLSRVAETVSESARFDALLLLIRDEGRAGELRAYGADGTDVLPAEFATVLGDDEPRTLRPEALPAGLARTLAGCHWLAAATMRSSGGGEGWLLAGRRERAADAVHDVRELKALAGQIALGVRNARLTSRVGELAADSERARIAREIHDGIAQMVYMLSLSLETAVDRAGGDVVEQRKRLQDLTVLAKNALWEVRQYIFDLRPLLSGEEGLVRALEGQVREFEAVSGLGVDLQIIGTGAQLPVAASAAVYRIVQEGLGNIFRHARASHVRIEMTFEREGLRLSISDDGVGLGERREGERVGHGMGNLRRRVEELGGSIAMTGAAGQGTRIDVAIPINPTMPIGGEAT